MFIAIGIGRYLSMAEHRYLPAVIDPKLLDSSMPVKLPVK